MATFAQWLKVQEDQVNEGGEATAVARLAKAWGADSTHGNVSSPSGLASYVARNWAHNHPEEGAPSAEQMLEWLELAREQYKRSRQLSVVDSSESASSNAISDEVLAALAAIQHELGWLRAALSMILPDDAMEALRIAAETGPDQPEQPDFAALWAAADHSG